MFLKFSSAALQHPSNTGGGFLFHFCSCNVGWKNDEVIYQPLCNWQMGYINIIRTYCSQCLLKRRNAISGLDSAKCQGTCLYLFLLSKVVIYIPEWTKMDILTIFSLSWGINSTRETWLFFFFPPVFCFWLFNNILCPSMIKC